MDLSKLPLMWGLDDVCRETTYAPSTIKAMVAKGEFPKPVALGSKKRGWWTAEIVEWLKNRPVGVKSEHGQAAAARANAANRVKPPRRGRKALSAQESVG
jgi:predicted DNA-binding transcriptional regulator AlpA